MKKKTFVLWVKILKRALIALVILSIFYVYFHTGAFTIHSYELTGIPPEKKEIIEERMKTISSKPIYKLIPANRIFSYHTSEMRAAIQEILPDTRAVSIGISSLHTLHITVASHSPLFRLGDGQVITKEGYIYKDDSHVETVGALPVIDLASSTLKTDTANGLSSTKLIAKNATGTEVLFKQITSIIPKINAVLFNVSFIQVNPYGDVILSDVSDKSSVKLSSMVDIEKEWSNVISAIDTEPLKTLLDTKKSKLEYIDVRFGNKVFYKFTNEGGADIIPGTKTSHATDTSSTSPR